MPVEQDANVILLKKRQKRKKMVKQLHQEGTTKLLMDQRTPTAIVFKLTFKLDLEIIIYVIIISFQLSCCSI